MASVAATKGYSCPSKATGPMPSKLNVYMRHAHGEGMHTEVRTGRRYA